MPKHQSGIGHLSYKQKALFLQTTATKIVTVGFMNFASSFFASASRSVFGNLSSSSLRHSQTQASDSSLFLTTVPPPDSGLPGTPTDEFRLTGELPAISAQTALFLDFDGTLVDLASDPDAVMVPSGLTATLLQLQTRLGGALAVVSGRSLPDLDRLLKPLRLPLAAEHGALRRLAAGEDAVLLAHPDLSQLAQAAQVFAAAKPGLLVEVKRAAVALHYRQAPQWQAECQQFMALAAGATAGVELLHGKCVFEIKPSGISKGTAISDFMRLPAFKGRIPVFVGDDATDESGFSVVEALGGIGIKVGPGATLASRRCASPADVLRWLKLSKSPASTPVSATSSMQQAANR